MYEIKMEMENPKQVFCFFLVKMGIFYLKLGKSILIGIGNGAECWPQNLVIESPDSHWLVTFDYVNQLPTDLS